MYRTTIRTALAALLVSQVLTGCVTETNDPLAQNRDPAKAAKAYVDAGTRYLQDGKMVNANRTLNRAYEIAPDDPAVNNALALFYVAEGEDEQAEKHFRHALNSNPGFSQARNNYAAYLYDKGRYDDAIEQLERVVKDYQYSRRYTSYENLGICYLKVGRKDDAVKMFNRALQLNPNMAISLIEMAEISLEQGDTEMAERYLSKYESFAQPSPRELWLGIRLQRIAGDKDKLASYELALKNLFPKSKEYEAYKASR